MFASSAISTLDPNFFVDNSASARSNNDINSKTRVNIDLSDALVLIIAGQSNGANSFPTPYTTTNVIHNLNIHDGAIYIAADPLLGCTGPSAAGHGGGRIADRLIDGGSAPKVLLVPIAISGSTSSQWQSATADYGSRIVAAHRRLAAHGLRAHAVLWCQGEGDAGATSTEYFNRVTTTIGLSRAEDPDCRWFIPKQTMLLGVTYPGVQAGQLALVDHSQNIWAGPNADSIGTGQRQDGTHFNDTGANTYALYWYNALLASGVLF